MQRKELEIFSTSHCIHDSCTLSYQMILKIVNTLKCDVFSKKFLIFSFKLTGIDCNNVAFSDYLGIFFCHSGDDLIFDTVFSFCSIPIKYFHQKNNYRCIRKRKFIRIDRSPCFWCDFTKY